MSKLLLFPPRPSLAELLAQEARIEAELAELRRLIERIEGPRPWAIAPPRPSTSTRVDRDERRPS